MKEMMSIIVVISGPLAEAGSISIFLKIIGVRAPRNTALNIDISSESAIKPQSSKLPFIR